jgi:glycosyltransferase involved in cell wall biosynthesis
VTAGAVTYTLAKAGPLGGLTILRFAHAFDTGGGTERYLDDLDRTLLDRSTATVIRFHLTRETTGRDPIEERIGHGRLVRVALPVVVGNKSTAEGDSSSMGFRLKQRIRNGVLYNPLVWRLGGASWVASRRLPKKAGQAIGAGHAAKELFRTRQVDLVVMHFFGGSDADEVIAEARKAEIPVALLNHYSNDRYMHLAIRKHAMLADGIGGVNGLRVPRYVRKRLFNVSDGIDTDFFRRDRVRPLANPPANPIILMPARVTREKGQMDLVRAFLLIRKSGLKCSVAFAGRIEGSDFVEELRRAIGEAGMTEDVHFLGDLTVEELRDWYGASAVVAFPTYHHEGLGRVTVEAQAMGVPVVAYATGGVAEGITDGKTGYLLQTGDIQGLAHRLGELLASAELRASMGRSGRQAIENHFSLSALAERHEQFYRQSISEFASRRGRAVAGFAA